MSYLLFAGFNYYPSGGWKDFQEAFETEEEAIAAVDHIMEWADWCHIVHDNAIIYRKRERQ